MQTQKFVNQDVFVVKTNGENEPGDTPAPFAGFVANKQDAEALKSLQQSWGLDAAIEQMRGDVEIVVDGDNVSVSMQLRPVV